LKGFTETSELSPRVVLGQLLSSLDPQPSSKQNQEKERRWILEIVAERKLWLSVASEGL
jgi:hypothetical protein